jgi:competence protein ComEC
MRKKIGLILGVALLLIAVLSGCGKTPEDSAAGNESAVESSMTAGNLVVKMLNVGQGDAILIQTSEQTVLIDTSDIDERDKLRRELTKAGVKKIDKVILTHPHADHIGGMEVVLDEFEVKEVYDNGMPSTSKIYLNYMKKLKAKGIDHKALKAGDVVDFGGGASFHVYAPTEAHQQEGRQKGYKRDPNNESVVGKLVFGEFAMMFTGDAEKKEEEPIVGGFGTDLKAQVLKAGHHGSKTSSSKEFLRAVQPETALISCGAGNDYGHPHKETMKKYKALHLKIFETDKNGTITVSTDGKTYTVTPEQGGEQ